MIESEPFDVLIVGAGPAGSFAAERLARGGARVALFDGRPAGEAKACGGGVTSKALKAWPHLLEAMGRTVEEVEMYSPAGTRVRLKLDAPFAIYSRAAFDSYLRDRATAAGAHVVSQRVSVAGDNHKQDVWTEPQDVWTVRARSGERWRGRVLVAADGANSPIARRLAGALPNAEMEVAFGYRAPLPKSADAPTVIAFLPDWVGYAWAFPRLDHISFGIATSQDAFNHRSLDALLWDFMVGYYRIREDQHAPLWSSQMKRSSEEEQRDGEIERKLRASVDTYAARIPGLAPETWNTRRVGAQTWALLGDAAGFADPVTGEGIYYALRSAELFAEAFLEGEAAAYEERWRADFGRELRRASAMRRRFYGEFLGAPFTDRMIDFARLHPGIRRTLRELVAGDQGYVNLKRTLARSVLWPL
ncbi:MAG TPA: NAD(P)/FAD-dependent oxidoreductase [Pyrinomonadaceae bacterium]|nr:NAD(P)/FAD-dependent oxidoreductase [Pyrinomonadaceae bacterium]